MNQFILGLTLLLLTVCAVHADTGQNNPCIDPSLYYVKLGGGLIPGGEPSISLGIGFRHRWGNHGLDLSLNGSLYAQIFFCIAVFEGLLMTKADYLYYPWPNSRDAIYFGGGVGFGMGKQDRLARLRSSGSCTTRFLTVDGVIGWEFRRDKRIKPLLQLEVSQPVAYFKGKNHNRWTPAVVISTGLGW